ncbi:spermatogenesis-associated protein 2-like protein [Rhinoderma darwinii]|uniref:spermatogenesis-associated protein 2-like protein n=1 Tax=Rhinoderma darwinii TaxID=43563 RepID=UPI003F662991
MSAESLVAQYNSWLLNVAAVTPCTDNKIVDVVRQRILEEPDVHSFLHNDAFPLISSGLQDKADLHRTLQHLACAFQTLEQAALHLYFTPWRKEFHTIKTYSGYYVHILEAALPQEAIFQALEKLNYKPEEDEASLKIWDLPAPPTLAKAALGFLAARVECNILADLVSCSGATLVNGTDLIQERRSWRGEDACMERLQKLVLGPKAVPVTKSSTAVDSVNGASNGEEVFYQPQFCDHCHEPWHMHVNGCRRMVIDHHAHIDPDKPGDDRCHTQAAHVKFAMHDCVFVEKSLEQCCTQCHMFHSSFCSTVKGCREKGHRVTQMTSSEKIQAAMEEQARKHQLHCCLQPGHMPHYRCSHCRTLHYINCQELLQCRYKGHNASMIMLERDQQLWLQRSLTDLTLLCRNVPAQSHSGFE